MRLYWEDMLYVMSLRAMETINHAISVPGFYKKLLSLSRNTSVRNVESTFAQAIMYTMSD